MPHPSIYHTDDGRSYTPVTFTKTYNKYKSIREASKAMKISRTRLSLIACRLRSRGFIVKKYEPVGINKKPTKDD